MTAEVFTTRKISLLPQALHVLTLTPSYPVQGNDTQGCFVSEPLSWLAKLGLRHRFSLFNRSIVVNCRCQMTRGFPHDRISFFSLPGGWGLSSSGCLSLCQSTVLKSGDCMSPNPIHVIHAHSALPCGHAAWLRQLRNWRYRSL